jgi:cell division protein FtsQ
VTRPPRPGGEPASAPVSTAEPSGPSAPPGPGARPDPAAKPSLARARSPWRAAFYGVAVVAVLAGVGWVVLGSKLLVVRSVVVKGNHLVSASQVRGVAGIAPKSVMIRVNTQAAVRRVESINQVQSASVSKSWPDRIVITVHERTPALAVSDAPQGTQPTSYDLVDTSGVVIQSVKARPAGLPLFQTSVPAGSLRGNPAVAAAVTVLHEVPRAVARSVTSVSATSADDVRLALSGGVTIVWGGTGYAQQKSTEITVLMRTHQHYYDVSSPGTAVAK